MAAHDIPAQESSFKDAVPPHEPSYEQQLALVESMMTCYDTPLTQAAGYTRDLLRTIIALRGRETPNNMRIEHALGRLAQVKAEAESAIRALIDIPKRDIVELDRYDARLIPSAQGDNDSWWRDYVRAELERAHDFYQSQLNSIEGGRS